MPEHKYKWNLGTCFFGGAAIFLGISGLAWRDFATNWQRVEPTVPHRALLACIAAGCEIAGGVAIVWRPTARAGAVLLTLLYGIFVLLWVVQVCKAPLVYDSWGNVFEELSLVLAALVVFAAASPRGSMAARSEAVTSRLYGFCCISYALAHFIYLGGATGFVPSWIPPSQKFWAVTTAVCFVLAAAAILSGVKAALAALLLTAEILGFELLIWGPKLIAAPHNHFVWAGNGINLALMGAAWVMADSFSRRARVKREASDVA
jgi:uncharacterized membrane protein YphA (DoxX/SURF4 family)